MKRVFYNMSTLSRGDLAWGRPTFCMGINVSELKDNVQYNCSISDASHAGQYTLCIYLLKMREYYRWEQGLGFDDRIDNNKIGQWLTRQESAWEELESASLVPVSVDGTTYDAFDSENINDAINDTGLVYSAGYVLRGKPHFFLAELEEEIQQDDYRIYISGKELARELSAPPALSQGRNIYIRSESLRRTIWEKVEESLWNKSESPLVRAISYYDFENNLQDSLQEMCEKELRTLVAHEIGEIKAGNIIGTEIWSDLLHEVQSTPLELMLRAIRDNLADCISTLPDLIEANDPARLHFFIATISNMRHAIFPSLRKTYDEWLHTGSITSMAEISATGIDHWGKIARDVIDLYDKGGASPLDDFAALIETNAL